MAQAAVIVDDFVGFGGAEQTRPFLLIDATTTERHMREASVATHPLEGGGQIVDHAETKLETIEIEGVIANQLLEAGTAFGGQTRVQFARQFFERAKESRLRLRTLKYGVIQPVVLERWPQTIEAPLNSVNISLKFRKMEFAEWDETELPPDQVQQEEMASKCTCGPKTKEGKDFAEQAKETLEKTEELLTKDEEDTSQLISRGIISPPENLQSGN